MKDKKLKITSFIILILSLMVPVAASSSEVVRVGYYNFPNYQVGNSVDSKKSGYGYEYLQKIAEYTGWDYEYVFGARSELIEELKNGSIDLIAGLSPSEVTDGAVIYSKSPTLAATSYIFQFTSSNNIFSDNPKSYDGKIIGVLQGTRGNGFLEEFKKTEGLNFKIQLYENHLSLKAGIERNECDAFVATDVELYDYTNLIIIKELGQNNMYAGFNRQKVNLYEKFNQAQNTIRGENPFFIDELKNRYFSSFFLKRAFSEAEKNWLKNHQDLKIGYLDDFLPYSGTDKNGKPVGLFVDAIGRIKEYLGISDYKTEYVSYKSIESAVSDLQNKKIDVVFPFYGDYWYAEKNKVQISDNVCSLSVDKVVLKSEMGNIEGGKQKIAVSRSSPVQEAYIKANELSGEILFFDSVDDCIQALEKGTVSATILNHIKTMKYIKRANHSALYSIGLPDECKLSFAVRRNNVELLSIINHGILLLGEDFINSSIYENSISDISFSFYEFWNQYLEEVWATIILIVVIIIMAVHIYIRKIQKNNMIITKQALMMEKLLRDEKINTATITSISRMYFCIYYIDLHDHSFKEMHSNSRAVHTAITESGNIEDKFNSMLQYLVDSTSTDVMRAFMNLDTLRQRLEKNKYVSQEFLGRRIGWCEGYFIVSSREDSGDFNHVIFAVRSIKKEKELLVKSSTDELTGCFNRRAYEDDVRKYDTQPMEKNFVFVSLDLNGLKNTNDTMGHYAGDELIVGCANCIRKVFGDFGKIYRNGGDEFAAILFTDEKHVEELKKHFEKELNRWKGKYNESLAVSYGIASAREFHGNSFKDICKIAEKRMYQSKEHYYATKGVDRRGNQAAFEALRGTYTKILKVNLETQKFSILLLNDEEFSESLSYSTISEWIKNFAKSEYLYKDDSAEFFEKTSIEYVKKHFAECNGVLCIHYRRMIDGNFQNVMLEIIPAKNYSESNQICFFYVKNID